MTSTTTKISENDPEDEKWAQETGTSNVLKCFIFTLTVINFAKSCKCLFLASNSYNPKQTTENLSCQVRKSVACYQISSIKCRAYDQTSSSKKQKTKSTFLRIAAGNRTKPKNPEETNKH
jgi:hypothetical protein